MDNITNDNPVDGNIGRLLDKNKHIRRHNFTQLATRQGALYINGISLFSFIVGLPVCTG
jgi:hypothetical protein